MIRYYGVNGSMAVDRSILFATVSRALDDDLRQAVRQARSLGFGGLQVDARTQTLNLTTFSTSAYRELRHLFASHDQNLVALRCETGPEGFGPRSDTDKMLDRADGVLRAAAALGCESVCMDLGRLPPAPRVSKPKPKVTKEMAGLLILPESTTVPEPEPEPTPTKLSPAVTGHWQQAMAVLGEMADRYGVMLAFESQLSSLAALVHLVTSVDCPWFGINFDTAAVLRDTWSTADLLDTAGSLVRQVRARDAIAGEDNRTKPAVIGRGDIPWRETLSLLDEAGYHGAITIDPLDLPDPTGAAVAGLKQLQAVVAS